MRTIIYSLFVSDLFLFALLGVAFIMITRWVFEQKARLGYTLGWLIGITFIVAVSSILGPNPRTLDTPDVPVSLNAVQVITVIFAAMIAGVLQSIASAFADNTLIVSLRAAGLTALWVVLMFVMVVADSSLRHMIALFMLAFFSTSVFGYLVQRQIIVIAERRAAEAPINSLRSRIRRIP